MIFDAIRLSSLYFQRHYPGPLFSNANNKVQPLRDLPHLINKSTI
jgi:hypothetical protein